MSTTSPPLSDLLVPCKHCGRLFNARRNHAYAPYCSRSCGSRAPKSAAQVAAPSVPSVSASDTSAESWPGTQTSAPIDNAPPAEPAPAPEVPPSVTESAWYQAGERRRQLADRLLAHVSWEERRQGEGQTLVLAGQGAKLQARRGALVAVPGWTHGALPDDPSTATGPAPEPAPIVLWPAMHRVAKIVILSDDGYVSLAALQLANEMGISVTLIGNRGQLAASMTAETPADVRLRRAQHVVQSDGRDLAIARALICHKLEAQRRTIVRHEADLPEEPKLRALEALDMAIAWLALDPPTPFLSTPEGVRTLEARAATAYFQSMRTLPLLWAKRAQSTIPPYWLLAGPRASPLSTAGDARPATSPFHSMLNYAYAALESACRIALLGQGFDVTVGLFHTERPLRPGYAPLVLDLMELGRAEVDDKLLNFTAHTRLHAGDFRRLPSGECRLHPQMARAVVAACRLPQRQIDGHAKWLRDMLLLDEAHATDTRGTQQSAPTTRPSRSRKRR